MDVIKPRRARRVPTLLAIAAAVVAAGAVAAFALSRTGPVAREVDGDLIWLGTVEAGPMEIEVRAPGRLVPEDERWITAAAAGVVERVPVRPGEPVEPGTVLLELSNPALRRERLTAALDVQAARAAASARETRLANEILDLEASVARLHADLQEATLRAETDAELDREGLVSRFDVSVGRFRAGELARLHEIELQRLERRRAAKGVELEAERARVEMARAIESDLRRQVDALTVRAAVHGVVVEIAPRSGERVDVGETLARVIDPARLRAELDVPQSRARQIVIGQPASVDLRGAAIDGRVTRIDPAVRDGVVLVEVALDGELPDAARSELRVDGLIRIERLDEVLSVRRPRDAREEASISLYRVGDDGRSAELVQVELGRLSVNRAQVRSGLEAGDRVILSDTTAFAGSERVTIR